MKTNGKTTLLARRTPFGEVTELQDSLRELLDSRWPFGLHHGFTQELRQTPVDMFERDGNVVVKAEVAGIEPEKIDVSVSGNELRISGERTEEKEVKEEDYYRAERSYGHVFRSVVLPEGCDTDAIAATSKDGVIEIVIPRKTAATTRKVEVKRK